MLKGLIIAIIAIYIAAVTGFVSAKIAEKIVKTEKEKEIAREMKEGFLFFVFFPLWAFRRAREKRHKK